MIKLTNRIFENDSFIDTLKSIWRIKDLDILIANKINILYKQIETQYSSFRELRHKILDRYAIPCENEGSMLIPKEKYVEYTEQFDKLLDIEFGIDADKIPYDKSMKLSGEDIDLFVDVINMDFLNE